MIRKAGVGGRASGASLETRGHVHPLSFAVAEFCSRGIEDLGCGQEQEFGWLAPPGGHFTVWFGLDYATADDPREAAGASEVIQS